MDVAAGATLTLTAAQANGRTITGPATGAVNITGASAVTGYDFAGIAGTLLTTLTFATGGILAADTATNWGNVDTVRVAEGATLTLAAAQATGRTITGDPRPRAATTTAARWSSPASSPTPSTTSPA